MCYELAHKCKYCGHEYQCPLPNKLCPTIHFDADANMCEKCREELEKRLQREELESEL